MTIRRIHTGVSDVGAAPRPLGHAGLRLGNTFECFLVVGVAPAEEGQDLFFECATLLHAKELVRAKSSDLVSQDFVFEQQFPEVPGPGLLKLKVKIVANGRTTITHVDDDATFVPLPGNGANADHLKVDLATLVRKSGYPDLRTLFQEKGKEVRELQAETAGALA